MFISLYLLISSQSNDAGGIRGGGIRIGSNANGINEAAAIGIAASNHDDVVRPTQNNKRHAAGPIGSWPTGKSEGLGNGR